ncbi:glycosyltransferase [Sulfurimonas sp. HSL3-7]|uniref:glycosyltransferase n=1 Tax=Sulfonitrofixus jiaomeiensis TaxID=3131938 RepID=UPI0031F861DB
MKKKIKVLFVLAQLVGGGAERVTINIMRLLDRNIFDIHLLVMCSDGPSFEYLPSDITLHDIKVSKTMFSIFKLRQKILQISPDVIYSTLFRTHEALYFALLNVQNRPIVVMRSQNSPKLLLQNKRMGLFSKFLLETAYKSADLVLAQTPEMKDEIIKYHNINATKVHVLLNPLDTDNINAKIEKIENPFDPQRINVVAAGRLAKQKGFDILIKSFKYVVENNNQFFLHIIGEDLGEKERLEQIVHELSLENNVKFWDYQNNPYRFFFFSDLYVLSSRWEGMPNTVIENLYLRKPIVATNCIPYMNKLIQNGKNGFLVDVNDITALADAIINYNKITMEFPKPIETRYYVNDFFKSLGVKI